MLASLFRERGVRLDRTFQLNFGGNTDFLNMLERERLESKKISETKAVTAGPVNWSRLSSKLTNLLAGARHKSRARYKIPRQPELAASTRQ